jgi:hypothetical protein
MQKILRILLLRPENSARGLQEIARDFQRLAGARCARRSFAQCVSTGGWLSERCMAAPAVLTTQSHLGGPGPWHGAIRPKKCLFSKRFLAAHGMHHAAGLAL